MALNTTPLGLSGVNALFKLYYGRDATKDELNYWSTKSDADLRPKLIPNSAVQLAKNKPTNTTAQTNKTTTVSNNTASSVSSPTNNTNKVSTTGSGLNTTPLGDSGVNALFKMYYGRDATQEELNYWRNKSDAELRPKLIPNSAVQLEMNRQNAGLTPQEIEDKKAYDKARDENPMINELSANGGSSTEEIEAALLSGDLSGIVDWQGQPFSAEAQQEAMTKASDSNKAYYESLQAKETADAESALAKKQADYQDYLIQSGQNFEADKSTSDQQAADQGVLFSGSRVQKEKNLQRAYQQDQTATQRNVADSMATTARDFQYKYGNENANSLNKYYNLGSNTFNPNKATGGVGSGSISQAYNPSKFNFQGTTLNERKADTATRAAGYLKNKGNKLLATGYQNQL